MERSSPPISTSPPPSAAAHALTHGPTLQERLAEIEPRVEEGNQWVGERSVSVSSLFELVGHGCFAMSGNQFKSWARTTSALVESATLVLGTIYGQHPQDEKMEPTPWTKRVAQAFDPKHHIRQTIGLGNVVGGAFSLYSGVQSKRYGEMISGVAAMTSGGLLMFTQDPAKAWARMSEVNLAVLTPAGFYHAIEGKDKWIMAGEVAQTAGDLVSYFYTSKVTAEREKRAAASASMAVA